MVVFVRLCYGLAQVRNYMKGGLYDLKMEKKKNLKLCSVFVDNASKKGTTTSAASSRA